MTAHRRTLSLLFWLLILAASPEAHAGPAYKVRTEFPETDGTVYALTVDSAHGIVYIGGIFTKVGGQTRMNVAAIDAISGEVLAWNPGTDGWVSVIAVKGSAVYLGGGFTSVAGSTRNRAAAVNPAGGLLSWNPNVGMNSFEFVNGITVTDNAVYLSGNFFTVGGVNRIMLASVQPTSGAVLPWNPTADFLPSSVVPWKGKLYVGGSFSMIGGQNRSFLAPLDLNGNVLPWIPTPNNAAWRLLPHGDSLYVAGSFTSISGLTRNRLARLLEDGSVPPFGGSADGEITGLTSQGGSLYLTGYFAEVNGQPRSGLASMTLNGSLRTWNPPLVGDPGAIDGLGATLFVGGNFTQVGNVPRKGFAAIYDPALLPVPRVSVKGPKTFVTSRGSIRLRGTSRNAVRVEVKAGKGKFRSAKGVASWTHRAKLRPGRNVVLVRSVNIADATSKLVRMKIQRD